MKMHNNHIWILALLGAWWTIVSGAQGETQKTCEYQTKLSTASKITAELYGALDPELTSSFNKQLLLVNGTKEPFIKLSNFSKPSAGKKTLGISDDWIDFLNEISHADAINLSVKGYMKDYLENLATNSSGSCLPFLMDNAQKTAMSIDAMNVQASHCSQMIAGLIAIEMAHHYLGHYEKYEEQYSSNPMNSLVTEKEWRNAVVQGARNALSCGLGVEGLKILFENLDTLPTRPGWADYFMPENVNVKKVVKDLEKMEKSFFLAEN